MEFVGLHPFSRIPVLPACFDGKVAFHGDCELTDLEIKILAVAFMLVSQQMESTPPPVPGLNYNIIFLNGENLSVVFNEADSIGFNFDAIIYPVGLWRKYKLSEGSILFAMVEELCHAVWLIQDETAVKERVTAVIQRAFPNWQWQAGYLTIFLEKELAGRSDRSKPQPDHPD